MSAISLMIFKQLYTIWFFNQNMFTEVNLHISEKQNISSL